MKIYYVTFDVFSLLNRMRKAVIGLTITAQAGDTCTITAIPPGGADPYPVEVRPEELAAVVGELPDHTRLIVLRNTPDAWVMTAYPAEGKAFVRYLRLSATTQKKRRPWMYVPLWPRLRRRLSRFRWSPRRSR